MEDGKIGISADNGNAGQPDGHIDTVSVIDLELTPPRVIDRVAVGDAPEGLTISPKGDVAVAVLIGGAGVPRTMWFKTKRNGSLAVLKIDGKKVTKVDEVEVGGLPEGVVFSPDGKYHVGNSETTRTATSPSSKSMGQRSPTPVKSSSYPARRPRCAAGPSRSVPILGIADVVWDRRRRGNRPGRAVHGQDGDAQGRVGFAPGCLWTREASLKQLRHTRHEPLRVA